MNRFLLELSQLSHGDFFLGEAGKTLKCNHAMSLAHGFGNLITADGIGSFAIGYDVRSSSSSLAEAVSIGLRTGGHHTMHIGACSTPMFEWFISSNHCRGGIMVAGGSSPSHWNGLSFYGPNSQLISADEILQAKIEWDLNRLFAGVCVPSIHHKQPLHSYAARLRQRLKPHGHLKLCLDVGNGLTGREFDAVIAHYHNLRTWRIGFTPDPTFPIRGPAPDSDMAKEGLRNCVQTHGCHLGAALDPDGSRLCIVDEYGRKVPPEVIGVLLAQTLVSGSKDRKLLLCAREILPATAQYLAGAGYQLEYFSGSPCRAAHYMHTHDDLTFYFDTQGNYVFKDFPGSSNGLLALIELINHLCKVEKPLSMLAGIINPQ